MSLTVLNVAYPLAAVGPDAVGGAEQVVAQLDRALTRAGHESLVIACEGSEVQGSLVPTRRWEQTLDEAACREAANSHREAIQQCLSRQSIDLVHLHGIDFLQYLPPPGVPVLVTLHLPPSWYPAAVFRLERPQTFLNCVSRTQQHACPDCPQMLPVIANGVPDEFFEARHLKGNFAVSLGRICPEKGFHLALEAAAQAKVPLLLAGQVFPYEAHARYFRQEIQPRLDRQRRFIGPVGMRKKRRLLASARCLVAPSLAPETSSLVAMEALASGTPVVAFPSGALAEIIEHGKTGFLASTWQEMAEAIVAADALNPTECRETARRRYSEQRMLESYLQLYARLSGGGRDSVEIDKQRRSAYDLQPQR